MDDSQLPGTQPADANQDQIVNNAPLAETFAPEAPAAPEAIAPEPGLVTPEAPVADVAPAPDAGIPPAAGNGAL